MNMCNDEQKDRHEPTSASVYLDTLGLGSWKEGEAAGDEVWYSSVTPSYGLET